MRDEVREEVHGELQEGTRPGQDPAGGPDPGREVFVDEFAAGLATAWTLRPVGPFPSGDGTVRPTADGLVVESSGAHPDTGEPAFAYATGPGRENDHLKWNALVGRPAGSGFPGFDTPPGATLTGSASLRVRTFGTAGHPFGDAVTDASTDLRLAAGALILADVESGLVFDFLLTGGAVYAFYERLARPGATHASFSYAVPVATRRPEDWSALSISYDPSRGAVRWAVDGAEVLVVDRLGFRALDRRHLVLDHGGREQPAAPRQLTLGLGLFSLLDAAGADGRGLVRLSAEGCFDPRRGAPAPQRFVDELGETSNRLFGQGAALTVRRAAVTVGPG
ncbi:DUF6081 family protein [Pseudofrankia inefficax]|uniref:Uncharacterized protein n=1 Tax=Pseudofrankia inefficax (strain DSM 45817 / CECT 9037 / DDB 130130 / EuI1c) TaxID=298654 RepID=E3J3N8_PSEI1|nr:DUF6081 family protein [Pseudofrankia inefficax]ADP79375.1 hypothetical protein FraEuI1c_1308 [Pseudofrankia inefficax]